MILIDFILSVNILGESGTRIFSSVYRCVVTKNQTDRTEEASNSKG